MSRNLSYIPAVPSQYFNNDGTVAAACKLFTYEAGTTTKLATYSDADGSSENTNPIVLDSAGRATIFLKNQSYKFILAPSTDTDPPASPIWTRDEIDPAASFDFDVDIAGTGDGSVAADDLVYLSDGTGSRTAGRWYQADSDVPAYSSVAPAMGFCVEAPAGAGEACTIRVAGRMTGLSGLTAGTKYYASGTAGAITSTRPESARLVGVADTTTSLVLTPEPPSGFARYEDSIIANVGNVGTGEDTLDSHNIAAGKVNADRQVVRGWFAGTAANNANGKTLKVHVDDTATDTTILNVPITASKDIDWLVEFAVIRTSSTTARSWAKIHDGAGGAAVDLHELEVNAAFNVTWANAVEIRLTAEATANDDVEVAAGLIEIVTV